MKVKFSLDKTSIQNFVLEHVEKGLFGIVVVFFFVTAFYAVQRERFDATPEDLIKAIGDAEKHLESTTTDPFSRTPTDYQNHARRSRIKIEEEFYKHTSLWKPPLFAPRHKRAEPNLFTVRELRAAPGIGAFRTSEKTTRGSDRRQRGQRWIVLTGLVPLGEQKKAFQECFQNACMTNPETDTPDYIYYRVERAEVDKFAETKELKWTRFNLRSELARIDAWEGSADDLVNHRYLHRKLTYPLGSLVDQSWDRSVTHPQIPLTIDEQFNEAEVEGKPAEIEPQAETSDDDPLAYDSLRTNLRGRLGGASAAKPGSARNSTTRKRTAKTTGKMAERFIDGREDVEYLLFRFFDFSAEPGKHYRYRVRLLLSNPNYNVETRFLVDPGLSEARWLQTEWSKASDVVTVPTDDRILGVAVNPSRISKRPPSAKLGIIHWDADTGEKSLDEFNAFRGQYLNYMNRIVKEAQKPSLSLFVGEKRSTEKKTRSRIKTADYITDATLLDMMGGGKLSKKGSQTEPGAILLLSADGSLVVHKELDDLPKLRKFKESKQNLPPTKPIISGEEQVIGEGLDMLIGPTPKKPKPYKGKARSPKKRGRF